MPIEGMKDSLKKRHPLRDMKVGKAFIVIVVKGTYNRLCDFRIVDECRDGTEIARPAFLSPLGRLEQCRKDDSEYEGKGKPLDTVDSLSWLINCCHVCRESKMEQ